MWFSNLVRIKSVEMQYCLQFKNVSAYENIMAVFLGIFKGSDWARAVGRERAASSYAEAAAESKFSRDERKKEGSVGRSVGRGR